MAELGCSADELRQACLEWADDLRWSKRKVDGWPLVFRMYGRLHPFSWLDGNSMVTVDVLARSTSGRHIYAKFRTSDYGTYFGIWYPRKEMGRVCVSFARGVCTALADAGAAVTPTELGESPRNRLRAAGVVRYCAYSEYGLGSAAIGLIVAYIVSCLLTRPDGYPPLIALACLVIELSGVFTFTRLRRWGMRAWGLAIMLPLFIAVWTFLTVLAFANS